MPTKIAGSSMALITDLFVFYILACFSKKFGFSLNIPAFVAPRQMVAVLAHSTTAVLACFYML